MFKDKIVAEIGKQLKRPQKDISMSDFTEEEIDKLIRGEADSELEAKSARLLEKGSLVAGLSEEEIDELIMDYYKELGHKGVYNFKSNNT